MTTRIGLKILVMSSLVVIVRGAAALSTTINGITWNYTISSVSASASYEATIGDGISVAIPTSTQGGIVVPDKIGFGNYPVTSIGRDAFRGCSGLTSVTIPSSVVKIGNQAFNGCSGIMAFIVDPANAKYCSLNGLLCSKDGMTLIAGVNGDVVIPEKVISIGDAAFMDCAGLTSINIQSSVTSIGSGAFSGCIRLTSVTVPSSVARIGGYAFSRCGGLTSVMMGEGLTHIGLGAFYNCSELTSVTIPYSVVIIDQKAFDGTRLLEEAEDGLVIIDECLIKYKGACTGAIVIPDGVRLIAVRAFSNCSGLTSVTTPPSLTSINGHAFYGCSGLTSVTIPLGVKDVGECAFLDCSGLTSVTISSSVTNVGWHAFEGCGRLTRVVADHGDSDRIKRLLSESGKDVSTLTFVEKMPDGGPYTETVDGLTWKYTISNGGARLYASYYTSGENMSCIPTSTKGAVVIPDMLGGYPVVALGDWAFYWCRDVTSLVIPETVTSIGHGALEDCGFSSIKLPDKLVYLGEYALCSCRNLTNVKIPDGITILSDSVFSNCSKLSAVEFPPNIRSIGDGAFAFTAFETISIPETVTSIGACAFQDCPLKSIELHNGLISIGRYAFDGCKGLQTVDLPSTLRTIGQEAFSWSGLRTLVVPESVTSIGSGAFSHCDKLESITIEGKKPSITKPYYDWQKMLSIYDNTPTTVKTFVKDAETWTAELEAGQWQDRHIEMIKHVVEFDLGRHGHRIGGGKLSQEVAYKASPIEPMVRSDIGWKFIGWDKDFSSVTSDMTVTALYEETYCKITMESEYGPTVEETVGYGTNYLFVAPANYVAEPGVVEYACLGTTYTAPVVGPRFEMTVTNDISFKWDIWSTNYVYEVEPNVPMKIDQEWLKKHISEEFKSLPHSQIIGSMNGQGKNGWPLWESYIMGIDPDKDTVTIEIEAPQTDDPDKIKINLANIMPAPGSGYKVRFAAIKDGKEIGGDTTLVIDLVGKDDPTGLYTIKIRISPEGSDTPSAEEELSQTFGVLKRTSSTTKTLVSVPWGELSAAVARDIRVTDIVKTATLDVGDKLHVYDKVSKRYDTWQIDADHQWRPLATYVVNEDGSVSTISAGLPEDRTVARGSAIWLERQDVSKPFYLYGQHVEGTAVADIDRGSVEAPMWNLIASPSLEPFDVRTIKYADPNDQIVVPTEDGPRVYTCKDGVWGTDVNVTETRTMPDGTKVEVVKRSRDTVNTTIPAGVGFWYVSQGGKPTIEW